MTKNLIAILALVFVSVAAQNSVAQDQAELRFEGQVNLDEVEADAKGVIDDETPFVEIPFSVRRTGSLIRIDHTALSGDLDPLLYLLDDDGNIIAENDDRERGNLNSLIEFPQAAAGQYRIIATRFGIARGRSAGQFRVLIDIEQQSPPLSDVEYRVQPGALLDAGFPDIEARPTAQWTIFAYYGGDTNLEAAILQDFNEFERAGGSDEDVRIIAMVDRHPEFATNDGNWVSTRIYEIGPDRDIQQTEGPDLIDSSLVADMGDLNTSNGETFAQFLTWGIRHFPANNYVVAMAGHGAGWQGLITDDTAAASIGGSSEAIISVPELSKAFEIATSEAGIDEFALLVNDACSMSSIEYFSAMSEYFRYSLASPEIVVDPALDMTAFVNLLRENAENPDFEAIGRELVDLYIDRDILLRGTSDALYLTSAVTNLSRFQGVHEAVEAFATLVNENPQVRSLVIGEARANTYTYTHFLGEQTRIDLGNFMQRIISITNDEELIDAASRVNFELGRARLYGRAGARVADTTSYYNIYFPDDSTDFDIDYFDDTPLKEWSRMLRNYYNSVTPSVWGGGGLDIAFHPPIPPTINITRAHPTDSPVSVVNPAIIGVEVAGRNLSYGDVTVDQLQPDGSLVRLSTERLLTDQLVDGQLQELNLWEPGITQRNIDWDATVPYVSDGETGNYELLVFTEDVAFLEGRYREPDSETWRDVGVAFDIDDGTVQRVVNRTAENGALAVIDIAPGSTFEAYRSIVSPDGSVKQQPGTRYTWPTDGLMWEWRPAPTGDYEMGLLMTSFGGSISQQSLRIAVNNDGLSANIRAESDPNLGFTLVRSNNWDELAFDSQRFFYRTQNGDKTANRSVYFPLVLENPENIENIAETTIADYGLERISEYREGAIDGIPGLVFDYRYNTNSSTMLGRGIAIYHNDNYTLVFAAEGIEGVEDFGPIWDDLLDTTILFDDRPWFSNNFEQWRQQNPDERFFFAPESWIVHRESVGVWLRYSPVPYEAPDQALARADIVEERSQQQRQRTDVAQDSEEQAEALVDPETLQFFATGRFATLNQAQGAENALNNLITGYATADAERLVITGNNTYFGEYHRWDATLYDAVRSGIEVTGRVYVTTKNEQAYAVWVETPKDGTEAEVFTNIFEIVVDSYSIEDAEA
jgi:hypothetical protein